MHLAAPCPPNPLGRKDESTGLCVWGPQGRGEVTRVRKVTQGRGRMKGKGTENRAPVPHPYLRRDRSVRELKGNTQENRRKITHSFSFTRWKKNSLVLNEFIFPKGYSTWQKGKPLPGTEAETGLSQGQKVRNSL